MQEPFQRPGVRGTLHRPAGPIADAIVLTHGAGSNADAPLLVHLARAFTDAGYLVLRFDLPFRQQRPKGPPGPEGAPAFAARDREGILQAVEAVKELVPGRIFAGGHSYGGRQTAMAAAGHPQMAGALLLLSYPLHPPRRPDQMRTAFFPDLGTPTLFVHGGRDPFASLQELRQAMALIPARTSLLEVEGAGHDLKGAERLAPEVMARLHALVCYPEN